jgi:hypothetical protein
MNKLLTIAILTITLTGCQVYRAAEKDFKTLAKDLSINVPHPTDTHWRPGTSTNK